MCSDKALIIKGLSVCRRKTKTFSIETSIKSDLYVIQNQIILQYFKQNLLIKVLIIVITAVFISSIELIV